MRNFIFAVIFSFCALAFASDFPLRDVRYSQRGILEIQGESPASIDAYVDVKNSKTYLSLSNSAGIFARIILDSQGDAELCEGGFFLSDSVCQDYVLRDFRNILGFVKEPYSVVKSADRCAAKILSDGYEMTFSNYITMPNSKRKYPSKVNVRCSEYNLSLRLIFAKEVCDVR